MTFLFGGQLYFHNRFRHHSSLMPLGRTHMRSGKAKKLQSINHVLKIHSK